MSYGALQEAEPQSKIKGVQRSSSSHSFFKALQGGDYEHQKFSAGPYTGDQEGYNFCQE
jgi:hypothetical protein